MSKPKGELSSDPVLLRIMDELRMQGKNDKDLVDHLGLTNGTFTKWKYRNGKSFMTHINEISEFLGVTPNYLLAGVDGDVNVGTISSREIRLVSMFRELDPKGQECVMGVMKRMTDNTTS